ncbi:helix-turn-helix domain-containing protein [Streptomyces termitum]|uniref:helix-turn-helix domain-containing protein n=1 Tax=Streptomyces termitum TaxID=67368 RepID=UPI0038273EA4
MAPQQISAPPRASGLVHRNVRLTRRYVVVSNDLAQHPSLSYTAKGVALHLQSLPAGTPVGIKALASGAKEGELRIAQALRELERCGFVERTRERLPNGRIVCLTVSHNLPVADPAPAPATPPPAPAPAPAAPRTPPPGPVPPPPPSPPEVVPPLPPTPPREAATPPPPPPPPAPEVATPPLEAVPTPEAVTPPPSPAPAREAVTPPPAPAPVPLPLAEADRPAADLLARLRAHEPRLLLSERDVRRLAPGVTAWLDRGADPDAVRRTLCADLPPNLRHPAGLLAHRLAALLPPPLPAGPAPAPVVPLQNCDACDHAFRAPEPGTCPGCSAVAA